MTLILKPSGRGNWHTVTMQVDMPADLFRLRPGHRFTLGDIVFRICRVLP